MDLFRDALYIGGAWVTAHGSSPEDVIDATTEEVMGVVPDGDARDVDAAVHAATTAFGSWAGTSEHERAEALLALADVLDGRRDDLAPIMSREVGTTLPNSYRVQIDLALSVIRSMAGLVLDLPDHEMLGNSRVIRVPVGKVAAITPWNYPLYQIAAKVAPALASGCTVVLKPSNVAPAAAFALAEAAEEVGLPAGVLNVITGRGVSIGEELVTHPDIDMVSLTGSVRAGKRVGELAAADVKRVTLELGGKSAALICPGADLDVAVPFVVRSAFSNNGQTCAALTRFVVPSDLLGEVEERIRAIVDALTVGNPLEAGVDIGPLANADQFARVQDLLLSGIPEGRLVAGGLGMAPGLSRGFFVRPTVVSGLAPDSLLAREEIFGPVLAVIPVRDVNESVQVANDCEFGLSGAVFAESDEAALTVAARLRTGQVSINGGRMNVLAPFGGFRHSGNGRELGPYGLDEYVERIAMHLPATP